MRRISCFIVENIVDVRNEIKATLYNKFKDSEYELYFTDEFVDLEELDKKLSFKNTELPDLFLVDLYRSIIRNEEARTIYENIIKYRINLVRNIRDKIGNDKILIVLSIYVDYFRTLEVDGKKVKEGEPEMWEEGITRTLKEVGKPDLIVSKNETGYKSIIDFLSEKFNATNNKENNK